MVKRGEKRRVNTYLFLFKIELYLVVSFIYQVCLMDLIEKCHPSTFNFSFDIR